jgi:hypothetical protein
MRPPAATAAPDSSAPPIPLLSSRGALFDLLAFDYRKERWHFSQQCRFRLVDEARQETVNEGGSNAKLHGGYASSSLDL